MFCTHCGSEIDDRAVICVKCGCAVENAMPQMGVSQKTASNEWLTAMLLCLFLGGFGIHRFYTKNYEIGTIQLVLGVLSCFTISWIWALVDFILILTGGYRTGDGRTLSRDN